MYEEKTYQSILQRLSNVPVDYLPQVDLYLQKLTDKIRKKSANMPKTMDFAGTWNDFSEEDFHDFLQVIEENRPNIFNRNIEI